MDPVSLAFSVVGLAALSEVCVDAFNRIDVYQQYGSATGQLETRFENQKFLFEQWGLKNNMIARNQKIVNHSMFSATFEDRREKRISETLKRIHEALEDIDPQFSPRERTKLIKFGRQHKIVGLEDSQPASQTPGKASPWKKFKWSSGGKERLVEQVEWFESMVQSLYTISDRSLPLARGDEFLDISKERKTFAPTETAYKSIAGWLNSQSSKATWENCVSCRVDDTCKWILNCSAYRKWIDPGSNGRTLWLHAGPGCGKSVTSAALAEFVKEAHPSTVLSYFCTTTHEALQTTSNILRSCLTEALFQNDEYFQLVAETKARTQSQTASETDIWTLFAALVRIKPGLVIILDGFDECKRFDSNSDQKFGFDRGRFLKKLCQSIIDTPSRLAMLSRDEEDIRSALGCTVNANELAVIEYQIRPQDVQEDIERFAKHQVRSLKGLAKRKENIQEEITQHLIHKSEGMFLWVRLQSLQLDETISTAHLRNQMANLPSGLDEFYERDWMRIQKTDNFRRDRTLRILKWVASAVRPLTPIELLEAIAVEETQSRFELCEDFLPEDAVDSMVIQSSLLEPCRPFLELREDDRESLGVIQLAHFSMESFLQIKFAEPTTGSLEHIQDYNLGSICIGYLSFGLPRIQLEVPDQGLKQHPFFSYATRFWMVHFEKKRGSSERLGDLVTRWFRESAVWQKWRDAYELHLGKDQKVYLSEEEYVSAGSAGVVYYAALFGLLDTLKACHAIDPPSHNNIGGRHGTALQAASANGHLQVVQYLLESGADVNAEAGLRGSALNAAAASNSAAIADVLLSHGADLSIKDRNLASSVNIAAKYGSINVLRQLLEAKASTEIQDRDGRTPIFEASRNGHLETVRLLLSHGADITVSADEGSTPLWTASRNGHLEVVRHLLSHGADITVPTYSGHTPLHVATLNGHLEVVRLLINHGADVTEALNDGWAPLYAASYQGHLELVRLLLSHGANITKTTNIGWTPLFVASIKGHLEVVRLLLDSGADMTRTIDKGCTPLFAASIEGHLEVARLLISHGANVTEALCDEWTPLYAASYQGHLELVRLLLSHGADITKTTNAGRTPLHAASERGHLEVVQLLLDCGADITRTIDKGWTLLLAASAEGHLEVARLLSHGANVTEALNDGWTALHTASLHGHSDIVRLLLDHGADITGAASDGVTPLHAASHGGDLETVRILLDYGADITANASGATVVFEAILEGQNEVVKLLIGKGADIRSPCGPYGNALQAASLKGHNDIVQLLLNSGVDINLHGGLYYNAVCAASYGGHNDTVQFLEAAGFVWRDDKKDQLGRSKLHLSAAHGYCNGIESAAAEGTDINEIDKQQWTALHWAAYFGRTEAAQLLLRLKADQTKCDWRGWTARHVAMFCSHERIAALLDTSSSSIDSYSSRGVEFARYCDSCRHDIVGPHHQCSECPVPPGYDLCFRCFQDVNDLHPGHEFTIEIQNEPDLQGSG